MFNEYNSTADGESIVNFLHSKLLAILQSDSDLILSNEFQLSILIIKA
jgi:hypothetical protein